MEIDSEEMTCENCGAKNIISNSPENNIYIEMKKANIVQGEKYIFDKPEEDPYDRLIIDNLIKTKIYDIIINKKNNEDEENKDNKVCVIRLKIALFAKKKLLEYLKKSLMIKYNLYFY